MRTSVASFFESLWTSCSADIASGFQGNDNRNKAHEYPIHMHEGQGILSWGLKTKQLQLRRDSKTHQHAVHRTISLPQLLRERYRLLRPKLHPTLWDPSQLPQFAWRERKPWVRYQCQPQIVILCVCVSTFSVVSLSSSTLACSVAEAFWYSSKRWYAAYEEARENPKRNPKILSAQCWVFPSTLSWKLDIPSSNSTDRFPLGWDDIFFPHNGWTSQRSTTCVTDRSGAQRICETEAWGHWSPARRCECQRRATVNVFQWSRVTEVPK